MAQIIPKKLISVEPNWQKELATAFTDPARLLRHLGLDPALATEHFPARQLFPMRVPRPFAEKMRRHDWQDPLLRQVMPISDEFEQLPGYGTDPLEEQGSTVKGLLHKYHNRVLLIVRGGCAVNCRYCFRRHFPYGENSVNKQGWQQALDYIKADPDIDEVILSGGDPLMAKDDFLQWLCLQLADIPQLKRLRIHTRLPVVIPSRITPELIRWFTNTRLAPVMVLHINHANEVDDRLQLACQQLKQAGVTLLNQAVLLNGVNDTADGIIELNEALFAAGIMPYYLHMLDKVQGAAHFSVPDDSARNIMAEVIRRQPGYLVPKLVREIGGQPGKTPVDLQLHP